MEGIRRVVIPAREEHEGIHSRVAILEWKCPTCGGPRGEPYDTLSYDGSRRLRVHGWRNPCGHVDKYTAVRQEASANGLNLEDHDNGMLTFYAYPRAS